MSWQRTLLGVAFCVVNLAFSVYQFAGYFSHGGSYHLALGAFNGVIAALTFSDLVRDA